LRIGFPCSKLKLIKYARELGVPHGLAAPMLSGRIDQKGMALRVEDVAPIWAQVIGIREADANANFFDLGGHSMQIADLVREMNKRLNVGATVLTVMEYPTVASFTAYCNDPGRTGDDEAAVS
jgi:hypothetical protein